MRIILPALVSVATLAGCAAAPPPELGDRPVREPAENCDASDAQHFVGRTATSQNGAALLDATGAAVLRWAPPRTALTMDYRMDRLTVSYDDDLVITRVVCG
ncbi:I78 family peptidase inhibitor [Erythrobacter alti]|uniref:I78 family peptidase inhibitor n=1 Tax=Erythrobacter alti TaxID=1896145 RepID=UPI0030F43996